MILDGWKNRGLTPDQVPAGEAAAFANGKGKKLYAAYQERLKTLNAADFGDLLLECIRLFREHPDVLRAVPGGASRYILVDEYQDTQRRAALSVAAAAVADASVLSSLRRRAAAMPGDPHARRAEAKARVEGYGFRAPPAASPRK